MFARTRRLFDNFWSGFLLGIISLSLLLASQYGFSFTIIREGFWSVQECLKPQTLIVYPLFSAIYYVLLGDSKKKIYKTSALAVLGFVLQDTAFMFFYCPVYSTAALARNIFLAYFSLFVLVKSQQDISLDFVFIVSLVSLAELFIYTKTVFNGAMDAPYFVWHDSLLKIIPLSLLTTSIKKKGKR